MVLKRLGKISYYQVSGQLCSVMVSDEKYASHLLLALPTLPSKWNSAYIWTLFKEVLEAFWRQEDAALVSLVYFLLAHCGFLLPLSRL